MSSLCYNENYKKMGLNLYQTKYQLLLESDKEDEEETVHMLESGEEVDEEPEKPLNVKNVCLGAFLAFLSGFAYTVQNAVVANEEMSFSGALLVRYLFLIGVLLVAAKISFQLKKGKEMHDKTSFVKNLWIYDVDPGQNICVLRLLLPINGIFGGVCILSDFYSVSNMPLGDASAIILSAPLPSMVLSAIFLGTRLRGFKILCGALLYGGVLLVIRPPFLFKRSHIFSKCLRYLVFHIYQESLPGISIGMRSHIEMVPLSIPGPF